MKIVRILCSVVLTVVMMNVYIIAMEHEPLNQSCSEQLNKKVLTAVFKSDVNLITHGIMPLLDIISERNGQLELVTTLSDDELLLADDVSEANNNKLCQVFANLKDSLDLRNRLFHCAYIESKGLYNIVETSSTYYKSIEIWDKMGTNELARNFCRFILSLINGVDDYFNPKEHGARLELYKKISQEQLFTVKEQKKIQNRIGTLRPIVQNILKKAEKNKKNYARKKERKKRHKNAQKMNEKKDTIVYKEQAISSQSSDASVQATDIFDALLELANQNGDESKNN